MNERVENYVCMTGGYSHKYVFGSSEWEYNTNGSDLKNYVFQDFARNQEFSHKNQLFSIAQNEPTFFSYLRDIC